MNNYTSNWMTNIQNVVLPTNRIKYFTRYRREILRTTLICCYCKFRRFFIWTSFKSSSLAIFSMKSIHVTRNSQKYFILSNICFPSRQGRYSMIFSSRVSRRQTIIMRVVWGKTFYNPKYNTRAYKNSMNSKMLSSTSRNLHCLNWREYICTYWW